MARFEIANAITGRTEIGYNPGKGENETLDGIDRGENPHCGIWPEVDRVKAQYPGASVRQLDKLFAGNAPLQAMIVSFFKSDYWDPLSLDKVTDQAIANNCYDCSVNEGEGLAALFLQRACNAVINVAKAMLPLLTVDGNVGPHTINTVNGLNPEAVFNAINALRKAEYDEIVIKQPKKKIWLQDWNARLIAYKKN